MFWLSLCSNTLLSTYSACLNGRPHQSPPLPVTFISLSTAGWGLSQQILKSVSASSMHASQSGSFRRSLPSHQTWMYTRELKSPPPTDIVMELEEFNGGQVLQFQNVWYHGRYYRHMYTWCGPQKGIEQFVSLFMEETGLASTSTSTNATQHDTASSASGVLRTQQSNSWQTPCKYSLWHTYLLMDFIA